MDNVMTQTQTTALRGRFGAVIMPNYAVPPVAIARGHGSQVWMSTATNTST